METSQDIQFYYGNRILFAGDASRFFAPMVQNDGAQAMEDAYVLKELLTKSLNEGNLNSLAIDFYKRRFSRLQGVKNVSNQKSVTLSTGQALIRNQQIIEKGP